MFTIDAGMEGKNQEVKYRYNLNKGNYELMNEAMLNIDWYRSLYANVDGDRRVSIELRRIPIKFRDLTSNEVTVLRLGCDTGDRWKCCNVRNINLKPAYKKRTTQ